ncbi:methylenetetrahydrofolate reductase [Bacteriovorax sp. PP10]|uniref:Methylenetetrahydrofolate reductase n=1 Tax=Bacteriovorax antarcticus TaxID=3088717 RepID=A0ABU5VU73_9BACT|nr:methylenetetrahydrofolate reductase [Bacteriovorax sp. PP10]MEA9356598.1 methylenetetrahydrofolate reductase [Bacteriovorax sp. PP10]
MKVIEHLELAKNPLFSYEIVPPPRGRSVQDIIDIVETLSPVSPAWIDVTSHSSSAYYNEKEDGSIERKIFKKRPGTIGICGIIQNRFRIDTVVHMLCLGFTKEETEDALLELNFLGIHNVLALRGDGPNYKKEISKNRTTNYYASDLVEQIKDINQGKFLDEIEGGSKFDFCVGVAAYPEKHFEAPNLKLDLFNLKKKVDAGADYVVTQMFFDNNHYFEFVRQARAAGITVPIIPGIKILKNATQLTSIPKNFYIDFPDELVETVTKDPKNVGEIGKRWADNQVKGLLEGGAPCIHFYIMNDTNNVVDIVKKYQK